MAPFVTFLENLDTAITNSVIKVYCVRVFGGLPDDSRDVNTEAVFYDAKGTYIQATFPKKVLQNLQHKPNEGGIYYIKNFFVRENTLKNRATNHLFRLFMNYKTEMYEVRDNDFPPMVYSFKAFGDISNNTEIDDQAPFFDIIGVITSAGIVVKQSRYRLIEVQITDENHNNILCTIWDVNVESYLSQLSKAEGTVPIIIVQFCKPNIFRGEVGVSTHYQASKVLINADLDVVKEFRSRIKHDDRFVAQGMVDQSAVKFSREFDDLDVKSLSDIVCLEDGSYWVFGKVDSIEAHFGEWYYLACKSCVKKLRVLDDKKYRCDFCLKNFDVAVKRFRFVVNIVDDTSNASLLLWDREVVQLIGKRVNEMIGSNMENSVMEYLPKKIEKLLLGKEILFKIQSNNSKEFYRRYPYTVNKICNIPEIVEKYIPKNIASQVLNTDVKLADLLFGADIVEVSSKEFVTPDFSTVTKQSHYPSIVEGSVKRCLLDKFDAEEVSCFDKIKKKKKKLNVIEGVGDDDEEAIIFTQDLSGAD